MPTEFNLDDVKIYFKPVMPWYKKLWYVITFRWNKIPRYKEMKAKELELTESKGEK